MSEKRLVKWHGRDLEVKIFSVCPSGINRTVVNIKLELDGHTFYGFAGEATVDATIDLAIKNMEESIGVHSRGVSVELAQENLKYEERKRDTAKWLEKMMKGKL